MSSGRSSRSVRKTYIVLPVLNESTGMDVDVSVSLSRKIGTVDTALVLKGSENWSSSPLSNTCYWSLKTVVNKLLSY